MLQIYKAKADKAPLYPLLVRNDTIILLGPRYNFVFNPLSR